MPTIRPFMLALSLVMVFLVACSDRDRSDDASDAVGDDPTPTVEVSTEDDTVTDDSATEDSDETAADDSEVEASDDTEAESDPGSVVVASCDIDFTYTEVPERALPLSTNALQYLLELGLEEHVVGYFGSPADLTEEHAAIVEAAGIEQLGSPFPYPSFEAVLASDLDFVFAYGFNIEGGFTPEALVDAGINLYTFDETCPGFDGAITLEVVYRYASEVAEIFRVEERANDLIAEWEQRVAAAEALAPEGQEPLRMFLFDVGEDAIFTAGGGALPTDLFARAGGENIFAQIDGDQGAGDTGSAWFTATHEAIIDQDPEVIVIVEYGAGAAEGRVEFIESHPALSDMTGVREQRYIVWSFAQLVPGPLAIDALEILAEGLWADD